MDVFCIDSVNIYSLGHCIQSTVEFSPLITLYTVLCKPQTPVSTVLTNNIVYTIHNSIALILCIDCLDMPFNVHRTDKVTMITVSGFLTI